MKTLILIITKDKVCDEVMAAAMAQGCEIMVNALAPVTLDPMPERNRHLNCVRNRNEIRERALKTDADAFLFVDSDVVLPPGAVRTFEASGHKVAGGWYKMHNGPFWVAGKEVEPGVVAHFQNPQEQDTPIDLIGMGCCFVVREALETTQFDARINDTIRSASGARVFPGECYDFAQKTKAYNPVMINMVCGHIRPPKKYYRVEESLFESIARYLSSRPASEVATLFLAIGSLTKE